MAAIFFDSRMPPTWIGVLQPDLVAREQRLQVVLGVAALASGQPRADRAADLGQRLHVLGVARLLEPVQFPGLHFARDARDYAAAHALLRHALSRDDDRAPEQWRFDRTATGKPFLIGAGDAPAAFSLSRAHGMVACAVTNGADVGVDVECIDRAVNTADIAARFFAPAETAHLLQLDPESRRNRFFDLWTLKEALVKALGAGMAMSLGSLAFTVDPGGLVRLDAPADVDPQAWEFGLFAPGPRHRLAVAARRSPEHATRFILRSAADAG